MVILSSHELSTGVFESLLSSSELVLLGISKLVELVGFLLSFVQIVVNALDSGVIILALSLLEGNTISKSVNLILVLSFFLSELSELVL
jgi:hypothetical protein